ncbi:fosmidomycin efflux system, member of the major facilitator superfamily [uncultured Alphaproteobacteria bacterium]|uniref:Fosmidomycin efflux system, member of the major facilitator superfamily n=1 Tax=uncultured Alphaproteobacteria bacterium TaxID=91750 RepID=A0A212KLG8_9PROT|nr:fosmidomycin efflux system, member of the major facilitator superfamily [uncultured Alphaproteobacteria bacterium]
MRSPSPGSTAVTVLVALSFCHMLNDMMQSLLTAIYPMLKRDYGLDFGQIGLLTLMFQLTASLLQPLVGLYTDKHPKPFSLVVGMASSFVGLLILATAGSYALLLAGAAVIGIGSSIFHPESSRVARMASGGRFGLAQSVFQVGGNSGQAFGPLLAALIVVPYGQGSVAWFSAAAAIAAIILYRVGLWYRDARTAAAKKPPAASAGPRLPRKKVLITLALLVTLVFSKNVYLASISSYYTFYLIETFGVSVQTAQIYLFVFLGAVAAGTLIGGPVGDRFGRKVVIWCSILGVLPFTLMLPYADLFWTPILSVVIGLVLASAFSAIVVYGQELMPGKVGTVAGLFFGISFGLGGLGAAVLGQIADLRGIGFVYHVCAFLPALGLLTAFLPNIEKDRLEAARAARAAAQGSPAE